MGFLWDFLEKLRIGPNPVVNRYIYSVEIVEITMKYDEFHGYRPFSATPRCRFIVPLQPMLSRQNYFMVSLDTEFLARNYRWSPQGDSLVGLVHEARIHARSIWSFPISHSKS
jgi:hypothetical protein